MAKKEALRHARTVCPAHCGIDACGILAHVKGNRVVKIEPGEFPDPQYRRICLRGLCSQGGGVHQQVTNLKSNILFRITLAS